jgi:FkbM family methyltransferase
MKMTNWKRNLYLAVVFCIACSTGFISSSCGTKEKEIVAYEVPQEALAPRLLFDQEEMKNYLAAFPVENYKRYTVKGIGEFYVDKPSDMIKSFIVNGQGWEDRINKLIEKYIKPGSTALDAGAHIGTHTILMAKLVGEKGRVYAFEPQKKIYRELYQNLKLNRLSNAVPLRYAVGDTNTVIEMEAAPEGNEGATRIGSGGDKAELRTIDSFGFQGVSLMKIDVEGFEDQVIAGARQTLLKYHPVLIVEIVGWATYEKANPETKQRIDNSKKKIEDLGYKVELISNTDYLALPRQ